MSKYKLHRLNFYNFEPNPINCLAYNEFNKKLALSRESGSIEIWNFSETPYLEKILIALPGNSVEDISWCGGRLFSTGLSGYVIEHDLYSLKHKQSVSLIGGAAWCIAENDQKTILAAGTEEGYVCLLQVNEDGISYLRKFDKQEGRVLCLSWHCGGNSLATGSVDAIRIWNVETGHAITRIAVGRLKKSVETIIWSIAYLSDYTVVSGDSLGRTSFWDGHTGTLINNSKVHEADVLTLCVNKDETSVYATGVDPVIVQFSKVNSKSSSSKENRQMWMKSTQLLTHSHDVRALELIDGFVVSGGVDCHLTLNKGPPKVTYKYVPVNSQKCLKVASSARCVLLQYSKELELWSLGKSIDTKNNDGDILKLSTNETKALQLQCNQDEQIICSAISRDGRLIAYSSAERIKIFAFEMLEDPLTKVSSANLKKMNHVPPEIESALAMCFSASGKYLLVATDKGSLQILEMNLIEPCHIHTFTVLEQINLLESSVDENICAASDHFGNVTIFDVENQKIWSSLPKYKHQATALSFNQHTKNLFVVYQDGKVIEYDVAKKCYSKRTVDLNQVTNHFDKQYAILHVSFDSTDPEKIFFHDENTVYSFSFNDKIKNSPSPKKSKSKIVNSPEKAASSGKMVVCKKFKHLLAFKSLSDDELLSLELTPDAIKHSLPSALKKKKFGT